MQKTTTTTTYLLRLRGGGLGRRLKDLQRADLHSGLRQRGGGNGGGGILSVVSQVFLQIGPSRVRLGAESALVGTEARMYGHVTVQIRFLRKCFYALEVGGEGGREH